MNAALGQWREDPSVSVGLCRAGQVWANGRIPAILDGEPAPPGHGNLDPLSARRVPGAGSGQPMRLIQLSDLHFGGENVEAVAAAGDWIRAGGAPTWWWWPAISPWTARRPSSTLRRRGWRPCPAPMIVTPGNHDHPVRGSRRAAGTFHPPLATLLRPVRDRGRSARWRGPGVTLHCAEHRPRGAAAMELVERRSGQRSGSPASSPIWRRRRGRGSADRGLPSPAHGGSRRGR